MKEDNIRVRLDKDERNDLDTIKKILGLTEDSKAVRACINFTLNVTHKQYGGNFGQLFLRQKTRKDGFEFIE